MQGAPTETDRGVLEWYVEGVLKEGNAVAEPLSTPWKTVGVAQLVRAPGCGPGGRGFEARRSPIRPHGQSPMWAKVRGRMRILPLTTPIG